MRRLSIAATTIFAALAVLLLTVSTSSQGRRSGRFEVEDVNGSEVVAREVLVRLREQLPRSQLSDLAAGVDAEAVEPVGRAGLVRVRSRSQSAGALVAALSKRPDVVYVEPNFIVRALADPNDPQYPQLWGLENTGQIVNGGGPGNAGSDIRASEAWDLAFGSAAHVVAILDTGIDYTHDDLAPNVWSAPAAFTVTIGGVPITCQAGTHGFNAINRTCDPMDDHNHGTHVAGTIGAVANNGIGVAGVSWVTSLMGLKFLDSTGSGTMADAIDLMDFAFQVKEAFAGSGGANIRILSNSWGGSEFSQAFLDQVNAANDQDMLFVAAAGNNGLPNDLLPTYPATYNAPNIVAVAATTNTDARAYFSNYSKNSVHLGAPGVDILSTIRGDAYAFFSGTSMATPHVSGAGAAALSYCQLDTPQLKATLVDSVDPVASMATTTISGGRLNLLRALQSCSAPPGTPGNLSASAGDKQINLTWSPAANASHYRVKRSTVAGGPYTPVATSVKGEQYTDTGLVNATTYYYVISAANVLGESSDSNEASATPQAPPDLTITSFAAPSAAAAGASITVSVTTKNQGAGGAGPSKTGFYISTNTLVDATDTRLNGDVSVPSLAPGVSAPASTSISLPSDLAPRLYYLIARADVDNVLLETSKANNASARSFAVGPDLVVSTLSVPSIATPGASFVASYTVKNQGPQSAAASTLQFYWSANSTFDTADTVLDSAGVGPLLASASQQGQLTLTTPTGLAWGTYYVLAVADSSKVVPESWESNNVAAAVARVGGDLVISGLTSPSALGAGGSFVVGETTRNAGGIEIGASVNYFYLSSDASLTTSDTLLGNRAVGALAPGGVNVGSTTLTIPAGTAVGTYYLFAKADGPNALTETLESNNVASRSVSVGPDLTAAIASVSTPVRAGLPVTVVNSVTNRGGNDAGASTMRFYLSRNYMLDASDVPLTETRSVPPLAAGMSSSESTLVTIPAGTSPGYYYLFAQADGWGSVTESSESNNTYYRFITVE